MDKKKKVLIVEDDINAAMDLKNYLEGMEYEVCTYSTSRQRAIEVAENEKPDVILLDVKFRGRIDNIETAREIQSRFDIPFIIMSGYTREDIKENWGLIEPFEYLSKPVATFLMKNAIESVSQKKNND